MVHVESALSCEVEKKKKGASHQTITSRPGQQRCTSGTADQLANCCANLLGEISIGSLVEPEDSKCSRWPGNLRWSVSHDSCSWAPIRRCNFVPFWCLLGDLVRCSLCLESLADSDRWPADFATSSCGTTTDPGVGLVCEFSILHRMDTKSALKKYILCIKVPRLKARQHPYPDR